MRRRLAVSLGDPCGIGPEILLKSLDGLAARADLTVAGPRAGLALLGPEALGPWRWGDGVLAREDGTSVTWIDPTPDVRPWDLALGKGSAASGACALAAVRAAAGEVMEGRADALVTLPFSKAAVHAAGFAIPGHTEYLRDLAGVPEVRMAFLSPRLNVVLHTVHQSLRSVVEGLSADAVAETLRFSARHFRALVKAERLRVALAALNPHAGEGGAFGDEERVLDAALAAVRPELEGVELSGPLPADSLFHRAAEGAFDLVVALYHDQGLIPLKTLEPVRAVNLTLGLPFLRTSPDHGTAFDLAGRGKADPRNFQAAAGLALRLADLGPGEDWRDYAG